MSGWESGSTRGWRKIRKHVLERDRYRCQLKITGPCQHHVNCTASNICKTRADCVHHLDGKAQGDDPRRCVAACTPCNLHIGNPAKTAAGKPAADPEPQPKTQW